MRIPRSRAQPHPQVSSAAGPGEKLSHVVGALCRAYAQEVLARAAGRVAMLGPSLLFNPPCWSSLFPSDGLCGVGQSLERSNHEPAAHDPTWTPKPTEPAGNTPTAAVAAKRAASGLPPHAASGREGRGAPNADEPYERRCPLGAARVHTIDPLSCASIPASDGGWTRLSSIAWLPTRSAPAWVERSI